MPVAYPALDQPTIGVYRRLNEAVNPDAARNNIANVFNALYNGSTFWQLKLKFDEARDNLFFTSFLGPNWDTHGAEPPSVPAREITSRVLSELERELIAPARLSPSAEGGIGLVFLNKNRRAMIEIYNNGEIAAVTYSNGDQPRVWETDETNMTNTIERIRVYLTD
jgi:hypothetical protein